MNQGALQLSTDRTSQTLQQTSSHWSHHTPRLYWALTGHQGLLEAFRHQFWTWEACRPDASEKKMQSGQRQLDSPSTWRWSGLSYESWDTAVGVGCRLAAWSACLRAGRGCYVFIILIFLKTKESCFVIHKMQNILRKPLWARLHFFQWQI